MRISIQNHLELLHEHYGEERFVKKLGGYIIEVEAIEGIVTIKNENIRGMEP